jgi:hypothetical protein
MTTLAFNKRTWIQELLNPTDHYFTRDSGVSETAIKVRGQIAEATQDHLKPVSTGEKLSTLLERLKEAYQYATGEDWEVEGNNPVALETLYNARSLISLLPLKFPLPEVDPDPDGQISLTWFVNPRRTLAVSIAPDGRISFAGIIGMSQISGSTYEFPEIIQPYLKLLYSEW